MKKKGNQISKMLLHDLGHLCLLLKGGMDLEGENDRVVRNSKGVLLDGFDDVLKEDLAGEGMAVVNNRTFGAVPAVKLDAPASLLEGMDIGFHGRGALELIFKEVSVVGGVNPVVGQGAVHVLVFLKAGRVPDGGFVV